jgi:ubiquinol-cytochrome c reductase core subunit 2
MPSVEAEALQAGSDAATVALETAHRLAFRTGLGNGLYAPSHAPVNVGDVQAFASSVLAPGRLAFLSTGLDGEAVARLVGDKFKGAAAGSAAPAVQASKYFGGETRLPGSGAPTVFVGFGHAGSPSGALAALAQHLNPAPSVKWGAGLSPLSGSLPANSSARAVYLPYSDAGLFGLLVQAGTEGILRDAAKVAVEGLKKAASGLDKDAAARAAAKARFAAASAIDGRDGYTATLAPKVRRLHLAGSGWTLMTHVQLLAGDNGPATDLLKAFDGLDAKAIASAAEKALKSKPVFVAVGDVHSLPYADEIGL